MKEKDKNKWIKRVKNYLRNKNYIVLKKRKIFNPTIDDFTTKEIMRDLKKMIKDKEYGNPCRCYYCSILPDGYKRNPITKNILQILDEYN